MVKDPYWLHAYWEIDAETIKSIKTKTGERWENERYILRVYDIKYIDFNGTNANYWFDIEVRKEDNNFNINLWNDNSSYCAEIGILTKERDFSSLARSNFVQTPQSDISNNLEEKWMEVRGDSHVLILSKESVYDKWSGEDKVQTPEVKVSVEPMPKKTFPIQPRSRSINKKNTTPLTKAEGIPSASKIASNPFVSEQKRRSQILRNEIKDSSLFSDYLSSFGGSIEGQKKKNEKGFFFTLDKEIIIYGRTEPDAEVWLGDKKIELQKDGSFTLRYALPDGEISFPFTAVSSDGKERRSIKIEVESKS